MTNINNAYAPAAAYTPQLPAYGQQAVVPQQGYATPVAGNAAVGTAFVPAPQTQAPTANASTGGAQGGGIIQDIKNGIGGMLNFFKGKADKANQDVIDKGVDPNTGALNEQKLRDAKKADAIVEALNAWEKSKFDSDKEMVMTWARG